MFANEQKERVAKEAVQNLSTIVDFQILVQKQLKQLELTLDSELADIKQQDETRI